MRLSGPRLLVPLPTPPAGAARSGRLSARRGGARGRRRAKPSVKTTSVGGIRGYDGAKKISGRKRHFLVETQGLVLKAKVHQADLQDRAAVPLVLAGALGQLSASAPRRLSAKSVAVLRLLADGYSHAQIVGRRPDITYLDICNAAREALRLAGLRSDADDRLGDVKRQNPRAYERWTDKELTELATAFARGATVDELAARFQRQPSAIRARLEKLGITTAGSSGA